MDDLMPIAQMIEYRLNLIAEYERLKFALKEHINSFLNVQRATYGIYAQRGICGYVKELKLESIQKDAAYQEMASETEFRWPRTRRGYRMRFAWIDNRIKVIQTELGLLQVDIEKIMAELDKELKVLGFEVDETEFNLFKSDVSAVAGEIKIHIDDI